MASMESEYVPKFWHALLPSMWFAAPFGILIDGNKQPFIMILSVFAIIGPIALMAFIYKVLPIENPGLILKGAVKGTIYKLIIPVYMLEAIVFLGLKGPSIIMDLSAMFLVLLISSLVYFKISNKAMPFSVKFAVADSGKLFVPGLITMLLLGVLALIHIAIRNNMIFVGVYVLVLLIVNAILWKTSFKLSWKDMER